MPLAPGTRLGPYEIAAAIGAGGMGEVYKARDTRLDRTVAIKVLPRQLAVDPQFRERFDREARTISQLTHPNICALYDVGEIDGTAFLVMEHLEGETLAERIQRGPLRPDEALRIGLEILAALDAAHRTGVIHRDLKPANVMLAKSGVKLLDFGLAKSAAPAPADQTMLPTSPAALTAQGTILGTFQYMAPEQVDGQEADARSDIWAFGCVLYEMLTGTRAFDAKTQAVLIAAIVDRHPVPVSTVQPLTPPALDRVIATCLAKDPADRFHTAHDLLLHLRWIADGGSAAGLAPPVARARRQRRRLAWIAVGLLASALVATSVLAVRHLRETQKAADPVQFAIGAPDQTAFTYASRQLALSPDGKLLAFTVTSHGEKAIYVRPLGSLAGRILAGSEGAIYPFWSPDSHYLAFFANGQLKKIQLGGGPAIVLCAAPSGFGGAWSREDVIVFAATARAALMKVSAAGGEPTPATTLDHDETTHRFPLFLPDGTTFLFVAAGGTPIRAAVKIGAVASTASTTLLSVESSAGYTAGHLVFGRGHTLFAQPFDLRTHRLTGDPLPIVENISIDLQGYAAFSASETGAVVYAQGVTNPTTTLTWVDRRGRSQGVVSEPGIYNNLALSPDDRRLAVAVETGPEANRDLWVIDLARNVPTRLTFDAASDGGGNWSPDGTQIAMASNRRGHFDVYTQSATQPATERLLYESPPAKYTPSWSPDGKHMLFTVLAPRPNGFDVWVLPLTGDRKPYPLVATAAAEDHPEFSPDGRWVAYSSTATGREEIYVRPFPGPGGQYQVSRDGGTQPQWRRADGRELYFMARDATLMAASVTMGPASFESSVPQPLFQTNVALIANVNRHQYVASRDGNRFLINAPDRSRTVSPITVLLNWTAAIRP